MRFESLESRTLLAVTDVGIFPGAYGITGSGQPAAAARVSILGASATAATFASGTRGFAASVTGDPAHHTHHYPIQINDVVTDDSGLVYVAGSFSGTADFDPSSASAARTSTGRPETWAATGATVSIATLDGFIAVYGPAGKFSKVFTFPGTGDVSIDRIALDGNDKLLVAGTCFGTNNNLPKCTTQNGFLLTLDTTTAGISDVQTLSTTTPIGNLDLRQGIGITGLERDRAGNVYVLGTFPKNVTIGGVTLTRSPGKYDPETGFFLTGFAAAASAGGGRTATIATVIDDALVSLESIGQVALVLTPDGTPVLGCTSLSESSAVIAGINTATGVTDWVEWVSSSNAESFGSSNLSLTSDSSGRVFAVVSSTHYELGEQNGDGSATLVPYVGPSEIVAIQTTTLASPGEFGETSTADFLWELSGLEDGGAGYGLSPLTISADDAGFVYLAGDTYAPGASLSFFNGVGYNAAGSFLLRLDGETGDFDPSVDRLLGIGRTSYGAVMPASGKFVNFGSEIHGGFGVNGAAASKPAPRLTPPADLFAASFSVLRNPFTTGVSPPTLSLSAKSDSGTNAADRITNALTPVFTGSAEVGGVVTLYAQPLVDGTPTGGRLTLGKTTASSVDGTWTCTTPVGRLSAGTWQVLATQTSDGVESKEAALVMTIDVAAPPPPAAVTLDPGSDSGDSQDDRCTNDTTPTITGTAEPGSTVTVLANATMLGTAVAVDGVWSVTPTAPLKAGTYAITAKATDVAGNVGTATAKTGVGSLSIIIDTTVAAPSAPDLRAQDDGGSSNSDNKTNVTMPSLTGSAEPLATVTLLANGRVVGTGAADSKGAWTVKASSPLADGSYSMTATAVDRAGNISAASKPLSALVIGTVMPAAPSAVTLASTTDSGIKGDNATNSGTPSFAGLAPAGARVNVYRVPASNPDDVPVLLGTASVGSAKPPAAHGGWTLATPTKFAFTTAAWRIIAKTFDIFGNESPGQELSLTVIRSAPFVTLPWVQESNQAVTVTFNRPVTGLKPSSLRFVGAIGKTLVDLAVTDAKVTFLLGTVSLVAVNPGASGHASTWRIAFGKPVAAGQTFTLTLKAAGSGIADDVGNAFTTDSRTTISG